MRLGTTRATQVITPFGSGYIPDYHVEFPPSAEPMSKLLTALLILAGSALFSMLYVI